MARTRPGVTLLALGALLGLAELLRPAGPGFVSAPPPRRPQVVARRVSTTNVQGEAAAAKEAGAKESPAPAAGEKGQKDIDDAVLQMAMAMAEEEETGTSPGTPPKKKEEGWLANFDIQPVITFFLSAIVIYSIGSSIISIATGRIQDRSGGDFTPYDFLDNIFSFKDWSLEYTLGFDPFKVVEGLKNGGGGKA